ncbi:MAG TPA: hypothetical protein VE967_00655 [Gemmatimonadaceae bacterium]|nr:hypothetical protein [Gemmatimonadaceae bacterium]
MTHFRQLIAVAAAAMIAAPVVSTAQTSRDRSYGVRTRGGYRLSGTYELDEQRSDNPRLIVDRATRTIPPAYRDRVYQNWIARLDAPQMISIDVAGTVVSMTSSNGPVMTFDANGRDVRERMPNGSVQITRAFMRGSQLIVQTTGNRGNNFTATFEPTYDGLRVTRRLDSDYQQSAVTVQSLYHRSAGPRWNVYNGGNGGYDDRRDNYPDRYSHRMIVPNGTQLVAQLTTPLDSRSMRDGQRVSLVVTSGAYEGATIEGVVTRNSTGTNRVNMAFDFDRITLRDGRTSDFNAEIESARLPNGDVARVDRSGVVHDRSRSTSSQIQNGAIGAAVGAIIGAIAGGKTGAAVGAVAGGGAGALLLDNRSDVVLPSGTELVITSYGSDS